MFNFTPLLVNGLIRIMIVWQCVVTPVYGESAKRNQVEGRPKHFVVEGKLGITEALCTMALVIVCD